MQKITTWTNGCALHEFGESVKDCAENAVKNDAELNRAELNGAELNWAELNWAKLNGAELNRAKLNWAELNDAELNGAKLNDAKLNDAELNRAELNDAELNRAELNGANFHAADMRYCSRDEDAKIARMDVCEWPVTVQDTGVYIGCKIYTRQEIMEMTEEKAAQEHSAAPIRWRRWGKAVQALVVATLGEE